MNLRILKKLSKRALPILEEAGAVRGLESFNAEKDDSYISLTGHDRKHWDRHPARYPSGFNGTIYQLNRAGTCHVALSNPNAPYKGTPMLGAMEGYYEREWEESSTWEVLLEMYFNAHTGIRDGELYFFGVRGPTPAVVFEWADRLATNNLISPTERPAIASPSMKV